MSYLMQCLPCVKFGRLVIGAPVAVRMYKFPSEHLESGRRSPKLHSHTAPPSSSNSLQHQSSTDTTQRGFLLHFCQLRASPSSPSWQSWWWKSFGQREFFLISNHWSVVVAGGHFVQRGVGIHLDDDHLGHHHWIDDLNAQCSVTPVTFEMLMCHRMTGWESVWPD